MITIPRWLKWSIGVLSGIVLLILTVLVFMHEPKPTLEPSPGADQLAEEMLQALNASAWDSVRTVEWQFMDAHRYVWHKEDNRVRVIWSDYEVDLHTKTVRGSAYHNGVLITGKSAQKLVQKAWGFFCNDSFWLIAPYKVFDPGTTRGLVRFEDGKVGLMVQYSSGGVTPGDTYVWFLDDRNVPYRWKMWVKVMPIGGLSAEWNDWRPYNGGVWLSQTKKIGPLEIKMSDIRIGF